MLVRFINNTIMNRYLLFSGIILFLFSCNQKNDKKPSLLNKTSFEKEIDGKLLDKVNWDKEGWSYVDSEVNFLKRFLRKE